MNKIGAILFLFKCTFIVALRMIKGLTWNMIVVDLEEKNGTRTQLTFKRGMKDYHLHEWNR
jgi:hypothetical protein